MGKIHNLEEDPRTPKRRSGPKQKFVEQREDEVKSIPHTALQCFQMVYTDCQLKPFRC